MLQQQWQVIVQWDLPLPQPLREKRILVASEIQHATSIPICRQCYSDRKLWISVKYDEATV